MNWGPKRTTPKTLTEEDVCMMLDGGLQRIGNIYNFVWYAERAEYRQAVQHSAKGA